MLKSSYLYRLISSKGNELPPKTDGWYGRAQLATSETIPPDDERIKPFQVNISDEELQDFKRRLSEAKICESLEGSDFRYGFNSKKLQDIVKYWQNTYNWKQWENALNKYDQFKTQIEGLDIHFVHVRPSNPTGVVLPLLIVHGWPGSFFEYYKSFPMLTDSTVGGLAFELIVPSIPGYGFSEAPHKEGFNVVSAARIFVKLMVRLGFKRFFVHGGDWGSMISRTIAVMYPEHVRGIHVTFCFDFKPHGLDIVKYLLAKLIPVVVFHNNESQKIMFHEMELLKSKWLMESGYFQIQSTKPDTVGCALTDSPVGLAAYILEKFSTWTDNANVYKPDGGLTSKFTIDELLTNVMIYWFSNNVTSSMRFYKENSCPETGLFQQFKLDAVKVPETVPAGYAVFPNEMIRVPKFLADVWCENLLHYSEMPRGGHFAAFEEPELLAEDLKKFARAVVSRV